MAISATQAQIMQQILSDPAYKGKHVIVVGDKVFTANIGEGAAKILDETDKEYPDAIPQIAYIPDADTLILLIGRYSRPVPEKDQWQHSYPHLA